MTFSDLTLNWFALYGTFDNFDYSLLTNQGIAQKDYENFCYDSILYKGDPNLQLLPKQHFELVKHYLTDKSLKLSKAELNCVMSLGFTHLDAGSLSDTERESLEKASEKKMYDLLLEYLFNPDNLLVSATLADGSEQLMTLQQLLLQKHIQKERMQAHNLLEMNLIQYKEVSRTTQVYAVGSTFYGQLSEDSFKHVLSIVYKKVLNFCNSELLATVADFPFLTLNMCMNKQKNKILKSFVKQLARASAIGLTLNDVVHLFGLNLPDVFYGMQQFGTPTLVNRDDDSIQLAPDSTLQKRAIALGIETLADPIQPQINTDEFKKKWSILGNATEPERIQI